MDDYYNQIAKGYDELHGGEQLEKLTEVFDYLEKINLLASIKTILDVGCGTGISSDFFAKKGFSVTGIDPAKDLLNNNVNEGISSKLIHAPAELIPFPDDSFDLVVSFTAIQNFSDLEKGLSEIKRVGKGLFVLTVLNKVKLVDEIEAKIKSMFSVTHTTIGKDRIYFVY